MCQLSRRNKQKNYWPNILFEIDYFPLKKTGPGQLGRPRRFYYLQAKCAGDAKNLEYIMNHGTSKRWNQMSPENKIAYRKTPTTRLQYPCSSQR